MARVSVSKNIVTRSNGDISEDMDEISFRTLLMQLLGKSKAEIRDNAAKIPNFKTFISSPRFLVEYARMTGNSKRLPGQEYIDKQISDGGFQYGKNKFKFDLIDFVFNNTRHGFGERDFPFDANHGVKAIQDAGECTSSLPLRNIFVLENMNVPVCRFDPVLFTQSWVLTLLRPKFVFRGLIACPEGDYGLIRFMVEIGNSKGTTSKSEISVPFKSGENEKLGKFIPFEIESPDYDFRPNHVFFFICVFYVNRKPMAHRGMRIANCTVQCVLPKLPKSLESIECFETIPHGDYDSPQHYCNYTIDYYDDPQYLKEMKKDFLSVVDNANKIRQADTRRAEKEVEKMFGRKLLDEPMDVDLTIDKRRREDSDDDDDDEPIPKKRHVDHQAN
uniref:Movement protein n=1 Tax=Caenorhabditis tropicalis TaxID=1561998 RepID=A0A1I7U422_9PELO